MPAVLPRRVLDQPSVTLRASLPVSAWAPAQREPRVVIVEAIRSEWRSTRALSTVSLRWLAEHGDLGDLHPIVTGLDLLRAGDPPR
jgi:hypothetical protein